jgi:hypothetical protein
MSKKDYLDKQFAWCDRVFVFFGTLFVGSLAGNWHPVLPWISGAALVIVSIGMMVIGWLQKDL